MYNRFRYHTKNILLKKTIILLAYGWLAGVLMITWDDRPYNNWLMSHLLLCYLPSIGGCMGGGERIMTSIIFGKIDSRLFCNVDFQFLRREGPFLLVVSLWCSFFWNWFLSLHVCCWMWLEIYAPESLLNFNWMPLRQHFSCNFSEKKQNN